MAVAATALFLSLGGVSYGLATGVIDGREIRNHTITYKDVKKDKLGGKSIKESGLSTVPGALIAHGSARFAVVNDQGQRVRQRSTTSSARTSAGRYQVIFDADVRNCAYFATIGDASAGQPGFGLITVSSLPSNVAGVRVRTRDAGNADADRPFHLVVLC
jgi:hypothetical protein